MDKSKFISIIGAGALALASTRPAIGASLPAGYCHNQAVLAHAVARLRDLGWFADLDADQIHEQVYASCIAWERSRTAGGG
jgi:hypothetical protein